MVNTRTLLVVVTYTGLLAGCSGSNDAELAKARAEVAAAHEELAKLRTTSDDANLAKAHTDAAAELAANRQNPVISGGVATFPDGQTREFTELMAYKSSNYILEDGPSSHIIVRKIDRQTITDLETIKADPAEEESQEGATHSEVSLFELARISFGPVQRSDARLSQMNPYHSNPFFHEVEIENMDGLKEKFLNLNSLTLLVKWKGEITTTSLNNEQICGVTFQSTK